MVASSSTESDSAAAVTEDSAAASASSSTSAAAGVTSESAERSEVGAVAVAAAEHEHEDRRNNNEAASAKTPLKSNRKSSSDIGSESGDGDINAAKEGARPVSRGKRRRNKSKVGKKKPQHRHKSGRAIRSATIHPNASHQDGFWHDIADDGGGPASSSSVAVPSSSQQQPTPPIHLPHNQYEVIIRRRAVIKVDDLVKATAAAAANQPADEATRGDINGIDDNTTITTIDSDIVTAAASETTASTGAGTDGRSSSSASSLERRHVLGLRPSVDEARRRHLPGMPSLRGLGYSERYDGLSGVPITASGPSTVTGRQTALHEQTSNVVVISEEADENDDDEEDKSGSMQVGEEEGSSKAAGPFREEHDDDLAGDTSLGLKLTIQGGHVIVQALNSLADGRASPAQLTGLVRRGDVLVAIEGRSLVHLPLDKLVEALKPLSEPESETSALDSNSGLPSGVPCYCRTLRLRFSIGEGLPYLEKPKRRHQKPTKVGGSSGGDGSAEGPGASLNTAMSDDIAAFFMVDQLSGLPMFGEEFHSRATKTDTTQDVKATGADSASVSSSVARGTDDDAEGIATLELQSSALAAKLFGLSATSAARLSKQIALDIAQERRGEKEWSNSLFYVLNQKGSNILRGSLRLPGDSGSSRPRDMTWGEMVDLGERAVAGAEIVLEEAKEADLAGGIEIQRRLDAAEGESLNESLRSCGDGDSQSSTNPLGQIDSERGGGRRSSVGGRFGGSNKVLLRLAARDELWRNQLLHKLAEASSTSGPATTSEGVVEDEASSTTNEGKTTHKNNKGGLEFQLQSIFWGEKVTKIIENTREKKDCLPPSDATGTLFDLCSEIAMISEGVYGKTTLSARLLQDHALASEFLLSEAIPALLKTFHPLPWQHRKLLWPLTAFGTGSDVESALTGADMTVSIASTSTGWGTPGQKKNLEEQIEDLELDVEVRAETCYLVTFYFTHQIIPKVIKSDKFHPSEAWVNKENNESTFSPEEKDAVVFIKTFGAYLKLHTSLVHAADAKSAAIICKLLDMARFDLRHRNFSKKLSNKQSLLLYENAMLSALLGRLRTLEEDSSGDIFGEEQLRTIPLLVAAFPDLRPWLVRAAFIGTEAEAVTGDKQKQNKSNYYQYLSTLMNIDLGYDLARQDEGLVEEWCNLSVELYLDSASDGNDKQIFFNHLLAVAKTPENGAIQFHRNVEFLMDMAMIMKNYNLVCDLAAEIIASKEYSNNSDVIKRIQLNIRDIFRSIVNEGSIFENNSAALIQRLITLFTTMATSDYESYRETTSVPEELCNFLKECDTEKDLVSDEEKTLIRLIAKSATPADVLETLSKWDKRNTSMAQTVVLPALRAALLTAARQQKETVELLRLRKARLDRQNRSPKSYDGSTWERLEKGEIMIDK